MDNKKNVRKAITASGKILSILAVLFVVLTIAMAGTASAKSMYLATHNNEIKAYDIGADGYTLTYQYSGTPSESDPVGLALDGEHDSPILFITFEGGNYVQIMNANTMASLGTVTAPGSSDLAGIVYDQDNDRVYCVDRGQTNLYVYDWNYSTSTLTAVTSSPFTICSGTYGIALDQINNKLYVATSSITIYVYALNADGNPFSISPAGTISTTYYAISVAVDEGNQYLYYGGGFAGNDNLSQYNLGTSGESHYNIASGEGVMGLDVDQDNHNVYISTGKSGDNLRVVDSSLNLLSIKSTEVTRPTGLVIPRGQISYNPLDLSKDDGLAEDECVNANEDITYQICYNNSLKEFDVHNVTINDTLPANTTFVSASDGGTCDAENRIVTWNIGTVMAGSPEACVTLVVRVNASAETRVTNSVTINSDETPQTTQSEDTTVCALPPSGESTDSGGWTKDRYTTEEDVYATGGGFNPQITDMNIYVFGDRAWTDGDDTTGYTVYASLTNVPVTGGNVGPVIIWEKEDTKIGEYDIFFDANKNMIYDVGIDAVDDQNHPGFTISGERQEVPALTPFGLLALVGLLSGIAVLSIRKRRG